MLILITPKMQKIMKFYVTFPSSSWCSILNFLLWAKESLNIHSVPMLPRPPHLPLSFSISLNGHIFYLSYLLLSESLLPHSPFLILYFVHHVFFLRNLYSIFLVGTIKWTWCLTESKTWLHLLSPCLEIPKWKLVPFSFFF